MKEAQDVFDRLRVCPLCCRRLKIHPMLLTKSCFRHGDFILRDEEDGSITVAFRLINLQPRD